MSKKAKGTNPKRQDSCALPCMIMKCVGELFFFDWFLRENKKV